VADIFHSYFQSQYHHKQVVTRFSTSALIMDHYRQEFWQAYIWSIS